MEQHELNTADFENEIGGIRRVSQVLQGRKKLTTENITKLANRFCISSDLFS